MNGAGLKDSRNVLKALLEKNLFFFQICVTPFNVSPSHRTLTVSAIIESIVPEVLYIRLFGLRYHISNFIMTKIKLFNRRSRPKKLNLFRWKVA